LPDKVAFSVLPKRSYNMGKNRFDVLSGKVPDDVKELYVTLIREASTNLPKDITDKLERQKQKEQDGSQAKKALDIIIKNINMAYEKETPICQDTGTVIFHVHYPLGFSTLKFKNDMSEAVREATRRGYLRPNAVDSITGKNSGDNTGLGLPSFYFHEWEKDYVEVKTMLKGGGSENTGIQYSLPDTRLGAGRDLKGIKKVILDSVVKAQGQGCAPGVLCVCIGGDRGAGAVAAKEQVFRDLNDVNPDPVLAELEKEMYEKANQLGVGPMGFGGETSLLGVKITKLHRLPASFFVSIVYMCWAARKKTMIIKDNQYTIQ